MSTLHTGVYPKARLPERVCHSAYGRFQFLDFDTIHDKARFWRFVINLLRESGDDSINVVVLDPDPEDYFYRELGEFGVLQIPAKASSEDYRKSLQSGPAPDPLTMIDCAYVFAWFPPSMTWLIWAERGVELMVLALRQDFLLKENTLDAADVIRMSLEDALDVSSNVWSDHSARREFSIRMVQNYGDIAVWRDPAIGRALDTAHRFLSGEMGVIDASRVLSSMRHEFSASIAELFIPFVAVDSETDHLPIGAGRADWSDASLQVKDIEIAACEDAYRPSVHDACICLIRELDLEMRRE